MRAEIVAVGSELLLGDSVDTNSAWISARLNEVGIDVFRHTTVGDNDTRLLGALREASERADVVIVTGGLGPTHDDRTRDAVAALAGVELERREELVTHMRDLFARRGRDMPPNNVRQADLPSGAQVVEPVGTAAGFGIDVAGATVWCLPGVPREMEPMLTEQVLPELGRRTDRSATISRVVRTAGMGESDVAARCADIVDRLDAEGNPTIAFLASRGETRVRITGKAATRAGALGLVDPIVEEVVDRLGAGVAGVDAEGTEHAVGRLLRQRGWRLAVAESVTGGAVGARLVGVPGASEWFEGGYVVYATSAKVGVADVDPDVLADHGPVSEEVAEALARAARERFGVEVGLGVVGVAGPTRQGGAEVGTVRLAVALPHGPDGVAIGSRTVQLPGRARDAILDFATSAAIDFLRRRLAGVD